jgi:lipopolysaccharide biosynthesis regulator YciM
LLKPAEAASELQKAFASSPPEVKQTVSKASEALRTADYEAAIRSLETIKARQDLTPQQLMTLHESSAALEARLIEAAASGDPKAKAAYERLRKSRRN